MEMGLMGPTYLEGRAHPSQSKRRTISIALLVSSTPPQSLSTSPVAHGEPFSPAPPRLASPPANRPGRFGADCLVLLPDPCPALIPLGAAHGRRSIDHLGLNRIAGSATKG
uniref:Uncharacterized protein n=1 Tax=Oryza meridionalis TaxID=40149 RepID=A0A0E0DIN3_9ORYZ